MATHLGHDTHTVVADAAAAHTAAADTVAPAAGAGETIADVLQPMLQAIFSGPPPVTFEFWDGSRVVGDESGTVRIHDERALRRIVTSPDELGLARAFVAGEIDVDGADGDRRELAATLRALQGRLPRDARIALSAIPEVLRAGRRLGLLGRPPAPPPEEVVPRGIRHSVRRDRHAVGHHYDVGNEFYELVLGPSMTYSCARFVDESSTLEVAQSAKHELICRKLGLSEPEVRSECTGRRPRLLDVGCGWGSMAVHAATHHDADVVAVTISEQQAADAARRVEALGLGDRVDVRLQDYRQLDDGPFDAISSIGMAEHVGRKNMATYFARLHALLRPGGRMLNHAISSVGGSRLGRRSFVQRYVFPDGELLDLGDTVLAMERAGFEVRDVENLREHYATTLRHWVANLERRWDEAVELVGEGRARVWRLYMSGSINGFDDGGIQLHQTLGVRPHPGGASSMPPTRRDWH